MGLSGHEWSIGMSGMTLFFSKRERLTLAIETGDRDRRSSRSSQRLKSKWVSPLDVSNVVPKTVFSVDEQGGSHRFELAISVTVCPGLFSRTKLITLLPRYQVVNLLHREIVIAQDGCLDSETLIPSQSAVPFHWEKGSLAPKVRVGAPSAQEKSVEKYISCWTNGRFRIDRVGITSVRLPTDTNLSKIPLVVQVEVRLATKDQSSAVVVVIWAANLKSNPLYVIRNRTPFRILCRQPLRDEKLDANDGEDHGLFSLDGCSVNSPSHALECHTEIGPLIKSMLGLERREEHVWDLRSNDVACFGFDDPEKPHVVEWTAVTPGELQFSDKLKRAYLEIDAMGSTSLLNLSGGRTIRCQINAEHSTKVIQFTECSLYEDRPKQALDLLRQRGKNYSQQMQDDSNASLLKLEPAPEDDEDPGFSLRVDIPGVFVSVVDNVDPRRFGREILLAKLDSIFVSFSQTREGYHEFELKLLTMQVDNHVHKSIHPILVRRMRCVWILRYSFQI
jgi:hypothetical protein